MFAPSRFRWFALLLFALMLPVPALAGKPGPAPTPTPSNPVVCLDAGHGGSDPGAVYGGMEEEDLTFDIAGQLKTLLINSGYAVVMTREGDVGLGNTERANICNGAGATVVLSIHLNASTDPTVDYAKMFFGKQNKDAAFAKALHDAYNLSHATIPDESIQKLTPTQFASGLLLKTNAPAAMAETVFLSHPAEQDLLRAGTRQQEIAQELFDGIQLWFSR